MTAVQLPTLFTEPNGFIIIGAIGLAVLILAAILDGVLDVFEFDGPVSLTTIAAFIALFGFTAAGLQYVGLSAPLSMLLGAVVGALGGAGAWGISRFFKNDSSTTASHSVHSLVGQEAVVRLRIKDAGGYGEIAIRKQGHLHTYTAQANGPVAEGTRVRITDVLSDTRLFVEPITPTTPEIIPGVPTENE